MWNEVIMECISVPPWNMPGGTEKSHDDPFKIAHLLAEIRKDIPEYKIATATDVILPIPIVKIIRKVSWSSNLPRRFTAFFNTAQQCAR
jgi:hypothetical protein